METTVAQNLRTYIDAELHDAALYKELAGLSPDEDDRKLLMEFSDDEQSHADTFKRLYRAMTGRSYHPVVTPPVLEGSVKDILRNRILDESGDYRKYGEQYLTTTRNEELRDAYYRARTDENVHALRILYLLSKYA